MVDILDTVGEKLTLLQLEGDAILKKNSANTAKIIEDDRESSRPKEDAIDNDAAAKVRRTIGVAETVEGIPFNLKDAHHGGVKCRGIARTKGHDAEGVFFMVGAEEGQLFLIAVMGKNLVIACLVIETDEEKASGGIAKIVNGIIEAGNGVFER
jgi:hypothetical protein